MSKRKQITNAPQEKPIAAAPLSAPPAKKKRPAALTEERTHALRRDQLQRWRMLEAEARAAQAEMQLAEFQLATLVNQRPEIVRAQTARSQAVDAFRRKREASRQYVEELGKLLGLDMRNVAIDEETGAVKVLPGNPSEVAGQ